MARKFTQSQGKKVSAQVRANKIGTHVVNESARAQKTKVKFSNQRRAAKAGTSQIETVIPNTSTRESGMAFNHRIRRRDLTTQAVSRARFHGLIIAAVVIVVAVAVAAGASWAFFTSSVSSKMALDDDAAKAALAAPATTTEPWYMLVEGSFDDAAQQPGPDTLLLARIDGPSRQVTLVTLPSLTLVKNSNDKWVSLSSIQATDGDAGLIAAVNSFAGVQISHLMKVDAQSFVGLVDSLGGVEVNLTQDVDDPDTGDLFLDAGAQTLDGASALVACRGDNYADPVSQRSQNQQQILVSLVQKVLDKSGMDMLSCIDSVAGYIKTDMDFATLEALTKSFAGEPEPTIYSAVVPGSLGSDADGSFFTAQSKMWATMSETIRNGDDPQAVNAQTGVDPAQVKIEVRNGGGVTGSATQMQQLLQAQGYQVPTSGNADSYSYNETLVVYKNEDMETTANSIVALLGAGRTVNTNDSYAAGAIYQFDTDLLVIVGKDFKPIS